MVIIKSAKMQRKEDRTPTSEDHGIIIPDVAGLSETRRRVFSKHNIPVSFRTTNTVRHRLNSAAVQCSEESSELWQSNTSSFRCAVWAAGGDVSSHVHCGPHLFVPEGCELPLRMCTQSVRSLSRDSDHCNKSSTHPATIRARH